MQVHRFRIYSDISLKRYSEKALLISCQRKKLHELNHYSLISSDRVKP